MGEDGELVDLTADEQRPQEGGGQQPDAQAVVVDCRLLQANGKECFKKF